MLNSQSNYKTKITLHKKKLNKTVELNYQSTKVKLEEAGIKSALNYTISITMWCACV